MIELVSALMSALITGLATVLAALISVTGAKTFETSVSESKFRISRYVWLFVIGGTAGALMATTIVLTVGKKTVIMGYRVPVGTVVAFSGKTCPPGWLLCDGKEIGNDDKFDRLKEIVGLHTPNMSGRFLRGLDDTGSIDPDRRNGQVLSLQEDAVQRHRHPGRGGVLIQEQSGFVFPMPNGGQWQMPGVPQEENPDGKDETRPKNVAVNFIIKY